MSLATSSKGTVVIVKSGEGFINEGKRGTLVNDYESGQFWVRVKWDDSNLVDGDYIAGSFEAEVAPEPVKVDLTSAIAELVDQTHTEAFEAGKAAAEQGDSLSDDDKARLRKAIADIHSQVAVVEEVLKGLL